MAITKVIVVDGKEYPVVFDSNALYRLEEKLGMPTTHLGILMTSGRAGYRHMQIIFWAGLESGRKREKTRFQPYTLDEVGELIDAMGGAAFAWDEGDDGINPITKKQERESRPPSPYVAVILEAWKSAFPQVNRDLPPNPPPAAS